MTEDAPTPTWDDAHAAALAGPWRLLGPPPECTILVATPAPLALSTLARSLRRGRLRVRSRPGRVEARSWWTPGVVVVAFLAGTADGISSPVFEVAVEAEGPGWVRLRARMRTGDKIAFRTTVPAALNRALTTLRARGIRAEITPWEDRHARSRTS